MGLEQGVSTLAEPKLNAVVEFVKSGDGGTRVAVEVSEDTDQVMVSDERYGVLIDRSWDPSAQVS